MSSATVKDVPAPVFIQALAAHFKKSGKFELPVWADLVKTATHKELSPRDPDWYFVRAASLARRVYLRGGQGVGAFTRVYGGSNRRGTRKSRFNSSSSGLIRHILLQLENVDIVGKKDDRKGRFVTRQGRSELDTIAGQVKAAHAALKRNF